MKRLSISKARDYIHYCCKHRKLKNSWDVVDERYLLEALDCMCFLLKDAKEMAGAAKFFKIVFLLMEGYHSTARRGWPVECIDVRYFDLIEHIVNERVSMMEFPEERI